MKKKQEFKKDLSVNNVDLACLYWNGFLCSTKSETGAFAFRQINNKG